jgi:RNA polymerase sigma-70 factor (ECF subfamily)
MLGSLSEAEDAVQEAWLRMDRADVTDVRNMRGWLTTVVARICLDMLRARSAHPEQPLDDTVPGAGIATAEAVDPEQEALLADSIGAALLVILQRLSPAERLAFVLHDMFDLPFAEIAPIVGRSENTAAQLAARARRRVRGKTPDPATDLVHQRRLVDAFLKRLASATSTRCSRAGYRCCAAGRFGRGRHRDDDSRRAGGRRQCSATSRPMPASPSPRW